MKLKLLCLLPIIMLSNTALGSLDNYLFQYPEIVSMSVGANMLANSKTDTLTLTPGVFNTYHVDKNNDSNLFASYELFFGWQKQINNLLNSQYGLAVATTNSAKVTGDILQLANPAFNNASFKYKVKHSHVALKGKLLADLEQMKHIAQPYISAGLGIGLNKAYDYSEKKKILSYIIPPPFQDKNNRDFTYSLGLGLQRPINNQFQFGVGYEFADFGKYKLKDASGQTTNDTPKLVHMYLHSIQFNISYKI